MDCDILLLCPFGPKGGGETILGRESRTSIGPVLNRARSDFLSWLGHDLSEVFFTDTPDSFIRPHSIRSSTAMTLATNLERAGLEWAVIDPGPESLHGWRQTLLAQREKASPAVVGVSTTFLTSPVWTRYLLRIVRDVFPGVPLVVGGYLYASSPKVFLTLDADVFVVGEGEVRLPEIVRRLKAKKPLTDIPGIYILENREFHYTGPADQLSLRDTPPTDWRLSERVEPPVSFAEAPVQAWVETQRGCVFKCEFCTYRTLSGLQLLPVDDAAERILSAADWAKAGFVYVTDATATFPHDRWERMMEVMIAAGGSRRPVWVFARVTDIKPHVAALMDRANVRHLFIGQESGDQRMLDLMQKATRVEHIKPAMQALREHGLSATVSLIHGFPGETLASIATTRRMLAEINDGCPERPVVLTYILSPFLMQAFAAIAQRREAAPAPPPDATTAYPTWAAQVPNAELEREYFRTLIETSRVPHAPIGLFFVIRGEPGTRGFALAVHPDSQRLFRLLKAYERGITVFLEHHVFGAAVDRDELVRVRDVLAAGGVLKVARRWRLPDNLQAAAIRRLGREWLAEGKGGRAGLLTRLLIASASKRALGLGWRDTILTYRRGFAAGVSTPMATAASDEKLGVLSRALIKEGIELGKQKLNLAADGGTGPTLSPRDNAVPASH